MHVPHKRSRTTLFFTLKKLEATCLLYICDQTHHESKLIILLNLPVADDAPLPWRHFLPFRLYDERLLLYICRACNYIYWLNWTWWWEIAIVRCARHIEVRLVFETRHSNQGTSSWRYYSVRWLKVVVSLDWNEQKVTSSKQQRSMLHLVV